MKTGTTAERSEARDRTIENYRYLCARGARKFVRPGLDRADLEQVAAIGLIKACDRFDERMETPFEAYAWLFVVGELMHYVRDHERMIRPPRKLRMMEKRYQAAHDALVAELGREPSTAELAQRLGVRRSDVHEVRRYRESAVSQSIDTVQSAELPRCADGTALRDDTILVEGALQTLNDLERKIILAVYLSGYSQLEIAEKLGYSRRHVSRIHRSALQKMRPRVQKIA